MANDKISSYLSSSDEDNINIGESIPNSKDTLFDKISDLIIPSDVSVYCELCQEYIYFGELKVHRQLHKSLSNYQFDLNIHLLTTKMIGKRRLALMKQLKNITKDIDKNELQKQIDYDFVILKNYFIKDKHQEFMKNNLFLKKYNGNVKEKETLSNLIFQNNNWCISIAHRGDRIGIVNGNDNDLVIIGQITGYHRTDASKFVEEHFMEYFKNTHSFENDLNKRISETCSKIDQTLSTGCFDSQSFKSFSFCTIEGVIINHNNSITPSFFNIGDCKIIAIRQNGSYLQINQSHNIDNINELNRLKSEGADITSMNNRNYLGGITKFTRTIGGHGNNIVKDHQIAIPCYVNLEDNDDIKCIIIYNSHVNNILTIEDIISIFYNDFTDPQKTINTQVDILEEFESSEQWKPRDECDLSLCVAEKIINAALLYEKREFDSSVIVLIKR